MQLTSAQDDDEEFVHLLNGILNGLLRSTLPPAMIVLKVDNWFGFKWLGFAGKVLGAFGRWNDTLVVPPFVTSRIISQRRFNAPAYEEVESGALIHRDISSNFALRRRVSEVARGSALIWYSGNSQKNGRGCMMAYLPTPDGYLGWYAAWVRKEQWVIADTLDISSEMVEAYFSKSGTTSPA